MPLTVLENAYFRKASMHPNYTELHQKILFVLVHEKKYYQKDELFCLAGGDEKKLDKAIADLEEIGLVNSEGWLVRLNGYEAFEETLIEAKDIIKYNKLNNI